MILKKRILNIYLIILLWFIETMKKNHLNH